MKLRELVAMYRELAGGYGQAVPLAAFGLGREETERWFGALDEDYHISRYFHLSLEKGATEYTINGFPHTHVAIDAEVEEVL